MIIKFHQPPLNWKAAVRKGPKSTYRSRFWHCGSGYCIAVDSRDIIPEFRQNLDQRYVWTMMAMLEIAKNQRQKSLPNTWLQHPLTMYKLRFSVACFQQCSEPRGGSIASIFSRNLGVFVVACFGLNGESTVRSYQTITTWDDLYQIYVGVFHQNPDHWRWIPHCY